MAKRTIKTRSQLKKALEQEENSLKKAALVQEFLPHLTLEERNRSSKLYLKANEALFRKKSPKLAWEYLIDRGTYSEERAWFETDYMISCAVEERSIITPTNEASQMVRNARGVGACMNKSIRRSGGTSVRSPNGGHY